MIRRPFIILGSATALLVGIVFGTAMLMQGGHMPAPSMQQEGVKDTTTNMLRRAAQIVRASGVDSAFIEDLLAQPETSFNEDFARINVTNYAVKTDYSHNYNAQSIRRVKEFISNNDSILTVCERTYGVQREVVAAILWVETKYGQILGKHHVPSVFLSVVLCREPEFIERNVEKVIAGEPLDTAGVDSVRRLIRQKADRKVRWAIDQLRSLSDMQRRGVINVHKLYGSWAGAFGLTQFLPSSYQRWAQDGNGDGTIDLYAIQDAVHSVANYLRSNGWGTTPSSHRSAIFHYNNSNAYVDAVLTLAAKVR